MIEIDVKFPYLDDDNLKFKFTANASGVLDVIMNHGPAPTQVTLYPSIGELQYALSSSYRYGSIDPMFVVGNVKSYNPATNMMTLRIKDDVDVEAVASGKVNPRMIAKKKKEDGTERWEITHLVSIDILMNYEENKEDGTEGSI